MDVNKYVEEMIEFVEKNKETLDLGKIHQMLKRIVAKPREGVLQLCEP